MAVQHLMAPAVPVDDGALRPMEVVVVHTSTRGTYQALKTAAELARGVPGRILLIVPQIVPYPLQLQQPPVQTGVLAQRLRSLAEDSAIETHIQVRLCRDRWEMLRDSLRPRSMVVLCGRRRWWPTEESRLARRLRQSGHLVVYSQY